MAKANKIFSKIIRRRDYNCLFSRATEADPEAKRCDRTSSQTSHYWGRGNKTTRYDFENCDGICGKCHMEHEGSKQGLYTQIKRKQLGDARFEALERRARAEGNARDSIVKFMVWCYTHIEDVGDIVKSEESML